jgi:hypothetical protein
MLLHALSLACGTCSRRPHPRARGHLTIRRCDAIVAHQTRSSRTNSPFFVGLALPNRLLTGQREAPQSLQRLGPLYRSVNLLGVAGTHTLAVFIAPA